MSKFTNLIVILSFGLFCSCSEFIDEKKFEYIIKNSSSQTDMFINNWSVVGPFTLKHDSIISKKINSYPYCPQTEENPDTTIKIWHNGMYHPKYGQLDLKEVFNIKDSEATRILDSLTTYLSCVIKAGTERHLFLLVRTEMKCKEYLNGDSLNSLNLRGMKVYPVHLEKGENTLLVRTQGEGRKYYYEATVYDSISIAKLYAEEHTGNIIQPIIVNDSIILTDDHCCFASAQPKLILKDVYGNKMAGIALQKDSIKYPVAGLKYGHAYICSLIIEGDTVCQPVMACSIEYAEKKYKSLRASIPDYHPRAPEIDQLLYRVWKLSSITGKMREDEWYPFKLPWVIYQLEHTFAHLDGTYGNDDNEYNFKYITYRSQLDGCLQRYILVTPNHVDKGREYPLIVVMRPDNEKHYHLFFCPQIAHQSVVNDMQAVANKYDTFIIMPEARMLKDEDLTPFAESEMRLALEDVQEHYNIDTTRIYLHANCSGGYRALKFAESNPDLFAGIALYAPIYNREARVGISNTNTPINALKKLRSTPVLIFGDPVDTHSPYKMYADLVKDCEKYDVPYTLVLRRNTGQGYHGYHRLVVGREACEFFKDKQKKRVVIKNRMLNRNDTTIADFYSRPFIYVYNASDTTSAYKELVNSIRKEYEDYLYARLPLEPDSIVRMPLIPDTRVTKKMLIQKNVFLIGKNFGSFHVKKFTYELKKELASYKYNKDISLISAANPYNLELKVLFYTSKDKKNFKHSINFPWINGFCRTIEANINTSNMQNNMPR